MRVIGPGQRYPDGIPMDSNRFQKEGSVINNVWELFALPFLKSVSICSKEVHLPVYFKFGFRIDESIISEWIQLS